MSETTENNAIIARIKALVEVELASLEQMTLGLGEDGLKRLSQCALIMQRIRQPIAAASGGAVSNEKLMQVAGGIEDE